MKPIKLGTLAVAAAVVLGSYSIQAAPPVTTNYSKLNVSLTIITNTTPTTNGTTVKYATVKTKLSNKELLNLFAHWDSIELGYSTNWPDGAQLVLGWDTGWDGDVLVVDKTGTNVLYDASYYYYPPTGDHYFVVFLSYESALGAFNGTWKNAATGSESWTAWDGAHFELVDDDYYLPETYLWAYGGNTQTFKQTWGASAYKDWSDKESAEFLYEGDQTYLDGSDYSTVSGKISASGKGKGLNIFFYGI